MLKAELKNINIFLGYVRGRGRERGGERDDTTNKGEHR